MSEENVEIVRRAYECLNRRDVEGLLELCDDDFLMDMSERVFNPDTYRGHDGIRRFYEDVADAWEIYRWDIEETRVSGDSVIVMLHCHGKGRQGPEVDWRVAWLWTGRTMHRVPKRYQGARPQAAALHGNQHSPARYCVGDVGAVLRSV